jgi:hypothetical protein
MTHRYQVRVSHTRGRYQVRLARIGGDGDSYVVLDTHDSRHDAERHRAMVRANPGAHWREPTKRGPTAAEVRWTIFVRGLASGRVQVTLERTARGERRRSCTVAVCESRREAEAMRERVRVDPAQHWREPHEREPRALESKRRARARQRPPEPVSIVSAGLPERLADVIWVPFTQTCKEPVFRGRMANFAALLSALRV